MLLHNLEFAALTICWCTFWAGLLFFLGHSKANTVSTNVKQMTTVESARDAAAKNVAVLQDKDHAMKGKIDAAQRNYEAGTEDLDRVLLAKIDRLNIQAQLAQVKAAHIAKAAEFNSNIASQNIGGFKETQE